MQITDEMVARAAAELLCHAEFATSSSVSRARAEKAARAALSAALSALEPQEPDGWKLVPVEPTPEMLQAADSWTDLVGPYEEANTAEERKQEFACAYRAMLAAAPPHTEGK